MQTNTHGRTGTPPAFPRLKLPPTHLQRVGVKIVGSGRVEEGEAEGPCMGMPSGGGRGFLEFQENVGGV